MRMCRESTVGTNPCWVAQSSVVSCNVRGASQQVCDWAFSKARARPVKLAHGNHPGRRKVLTRIPILQDVAPWNRFNLYGASLLQLHHGMCRRGLLPPTCDGGCSTCADDCPHGEDCGMNDSCARHSVCLLWKKFQEMGQWQAPARA
jgi:hypothetical protein